MGRDVTRACSAQHVTKKNKAVLIFSADLQTDLATRGLTEKFGELLGIPSITAEVIAEADVHIFTTGSVSGEHPPIFTHAQYGACFAERLQNAIQILVDLGYEQLVLIGRDCPELHSRDIITAFELLQSYRLIIGPDHRGGCYLIGFHSEQSPNLRGIRWQANTDCNQLQEAFGAEHTILLAVKQDIDSIADVRILARKKNKWGFIARNLLLQEENVIFEFEDLSAALQLATDAQRRLWQLPPPSILSFAY